MIFILGGQAQGKTAYAEAAYPDRKLVKGYHRCVREALLDGKNPLSEAEALLREEDRKELVILSDEIGYGIVPLDPFERSWREMNGRVNCYFAQEADEVIRVTAGIGQRIK